MPKMEKREVTFTFPDRDSAQRFLRAVETTRARGVDTVVELRGTRVKVKVFGPHAAVKAHLRRLGELRRTVLSESEEEKQVRLHLSTICREAGAPKVPPELLRDALRRRGYRARVRGPWITTDAPMSELRELVKGLAEAYREARFYAASEPVRRMLAVLSHEYDVDPMDLAYEAIERGVLREGDDGRCELLEDPKSTERKLEEIASELRKARKGKGRTLEDLLHEPL
ncbi:DUF2067 family protein [Methanopyrus sp.]